MSNHTWEFIYRLAECGLLCFCAFHACADVSEKKYPNWKTKHLV